MRPQLSLLLCLAAVAYVAILLAGVSATARTTNLPGAWTPIKDVGDPHVKEIAEFAVREHNRRSNSSLVLERVVSGETQVVAGTNYRLTMDCKDDESGCNGRYEAIVWEKPWLHFRKLVSFKPSSDAEELD